MQGGPLVFAPFKADSDYFAADKTFMLNLRVTDLDGMLEQLNASGIAIETRDEWDSPETGRFARIHDPRATRSNCGRSRRREMAGRDRRHCSYSVAGRFDRQSTPRRSCRRR